MVEVRVPFELDRQAIDDVERGANDSDWQPAKGMPRAGSPLPRTALFYEGYDAAGIVGIRQGTSNPADEHFRPTCARGSTPKPLPKA